jgi:hypothetical protein
VSAIRILQFPSIYTKISQVVFPLRLSGINYVLIFNLIHARYMFRPFDDFCYLITSIIYDDPCRLRSFCATVWLYVSCSFIHLVVCLTTGPKPLPKRALYVVRSRASPFKWEYPLFSLRSSSSFLRLLPCLPVTSMHPCIFPSITRCRRQFLRKM